MADLLIVDDDADVADALSEVMEAEGHVVSVAYNGREGFAKLRSQFSDVVLLDVDMPILDGPSTVSALIAHDLGLENVPIVLMSGTPNLRKIAAEIGTPYLLEKPFTCERLVDVVRVALRQHAPPRPASA